MTRVYKQFEFLCSDGVLFFRVRGMCGCFVYFSWGVLSLPLFFLCWLWIFFFFFMKPNFFFFFTICLSLPGKIRDTKTFLVVILGHDQLFSKSKSSFLYLRFLKLRLFVCECHKLHKTSQKWTFKASLMRKSRPIRVALKTFFQQTQLGKWFYQSMSVENPTPQSYTGSKSHFLFIFFLCRHECVWRLR